MTDAQGAVAYKAARVLDGATLSRYEQEDMAKAVLTLTAQLQAANERADEALSERDLQSLQAMALAAEKAELLSQIAALKEGLSPFAAFGKLYLAQINEHVPDDKLLWSVYSVDTGSLNLRIGDLRRAAALTRTENT